MTQRLRNRFLLIGLVVVIGFIIGYAYASISVLKNLSADFLLGDYVYERTEPRTYFPIVRPIRDWYFMNGGKERVIEQMKQDGLLGALPFTLYSDVLERFPEKRDRALAVIQYTFCGLSTVEQQDILYRISKVRGSSFRNIQAIPPCKNNKDESNGPG